MENCVGKNAENAIIVRVDLVCNVAMDKDVAGLRSTLSDRARQFRQRRTFAAPITLSGTRLSAQPIQSSWERFEAHQPRGRRMQRVRREGQTLGACPWADLSKKSGSTCWTSLDQRALATRMRARVGMASEVGMLLLKEFSWVL